MSKYFLPLQTKQIAQQKQVRLFLLQRYIIIIILNVFLDKERRNFIHWNLKSVYKFALKMKTLTILIGKMDKKICKSQS